ncbi:hypothetical protein P389DRAFT_165530 [Cystobasidium minutum MCA 4210]|uniref:uncharacterized protein n=1 Tax=Cystobasidium minutum MCA 4210 TaxID=1397322 RepID=UPI0034CF82EB|eukprot:jgi/Rhomi1/165530/fgenesh1_kg.1_\
MILLRWQNYSLFGLALIVGCLLLATPSNAAHPFSPSSKDASSSLYFCKCMCFSNYTILPLYRPADPAKPCLSCTKQFCLDQKLSICKDASLGDVDPDVATGNEGDIQTRCFQRDSALSYSVVVIFIILTGGLLIGAATKDRLSKRLSHTPLQAWYDRITRRRWIR